MRKDGLQHGNCNDEGKILQGVSRSFALTIPQLPGGLRKAVTNGYLLCRIADTIEDEDGLGVAQKGSFFREFIDVLEGRTSAEHFVSGLYPLLSDRTLAAEKDLILCTPLVVRTMMGFNAKQQTALKRCATIMSEGMQAFQEMKSPSGLRDLTQLDHYCYHVAGVVGEMLTELFCQHSEEISKNRERLFALAVSFGQGLQMTNILKDLWDDRARGACWLPRDVFLKSGFDLGNLTKEKYEEAFGNGLAALIGITLVHLKNALSYSLMIPKQERGIRRFCLWAIGMAIFTLRNINRRRDFGSGQDVKISRRTARAVILLSNLALRNNFLLKTLFEITTRPLPAGNTL